MTKPAFLSKCLASVEVLVHFQCALCNKWWSIGDAPDRDYWYCPWCGVKLERIMSNDQKSTVPPN